MDVHHLKNLLRCMTTSPSRRDLGRALAGVALGSVPGSFGFGEAEAGQRKKKRRRRRKRRKKNRAHVCQGRDTCVGLPLETCSADPNCFCFSDAEGEPICAKGNTVASCAQCQQQFPGRLCFPGTGDQCGAFSCVVECPT